MRKCEVCNKQYEIKRQTVNDEEHEIEVGHLFDCVYYEIDPRDRKYLPLEGFVKYGQ